MQPNMELAVAVLPCCAQLPASWPCAGSLQLHLTCMARHRVCLALRAVMIRRVAAAIFNGAILTGPKRFGMMPHASPLTAFNLCGDCSHGPCVIYILIPHVPGERSFYGISSFNGAPGIIRLQPAGCYPLVLTHLEARRRFLLKNSIVPTLGMYGECSRSRGHGQARMLWLQSLGHDAPPHSICRTRACWGGPCTSASVPRPARYSATCCHQ